MKAVATATPPPRAIGTTLTRRWFGLVDSVDPKGDVADERGEDEGDDGGSRERREDVRQRLFGERAEPHAAGSPVGLAGPVRPGNRKACTDVRDAGRQARLLGRVVAVARSPR